MMHFEEITSSCNCLTPIPVCICSRKQEFVDLNLIVLRSSGVKDIPDNNDRSIVILDHSRIDNTSTDCRHLLDPIHLKVCTIIEEFTEDQVIILVVNTNKEESIIGDHHDLMHLLRIILRCNLTLLNQITFNTTLDDPHIIRINRVSIGVTAKIDTLLLVQSDRSHIISSGATRDTSDCSLPLQNTVRIVCIVESRLIQTQPDIWVKCIVVRVFSLACNVNKVVFWSIIDNHFEEFSPLLVSIDRNKSPFPNPLTKIIKLGKETRLITIWLNNLTANICKTLSSNFDIVNANDTSCFHILGQPITSLLKLLRVRDTNLRRILRIITITRVNNVDFVNLTSILQYNFQLTILSR